jgi:hypothetical protein
MKQTINQSDFIDAFRSYDRFDQFGYAALCSLFDYLEDMDEDMDLDVIALCCDYSTDTVEDIADNYSIDIEGLDDDDSRDAVVEYLNDNTTVIDSDCDGKILYCSAF